MIIIVRIALEAFLLRASNGASYCTKAAFEILELLGQLNLPGHATTSKKEAMK